MYFTAMGVIQFPISEGDTAFSCIKLRHTEQFWGRETSQMQQPVAAAGQGLPVAALYAFVSPALGCCSGNC